MRPDLRVRAGLASDPATLEVMIDELVTHYRSVGKTRGPDAATAMVRRAPAEQASVVMAFEGETVQGVACFGLLRPG